MSLRTLAEAAKSLRATVGFELMFALKPSTLLERRPIWNNADCLGASVSNTSSIAETETDAPGLAPSKPAIVPSAEEITSVPN